MQNKIDLDNFVSSDRDSFHSSISGPERSNTVKSNISTKTSVKRKKSVNKKAEEKRVEDEEKSSRKVELIRLMGEGKITTATYFELVARLDSENAPGSS